MTMSAAWSTSALRRLVGVVTSSVPCRGNSSSVFYSPNRNRLNAPEFGLPVIGGYLVDARVGTRTPVASGLIPKYDTPLRIEIANREDITMLGQFYTYTFITYNKLMKRVNGCYDEMGQFFYDVLNATIDQHRCLVVFADSRLVAFGVFGHHGKDEFDEIYPEGYCQNNPQLTFMDDYKDVINKTPYQFNTARRFYGLVDTIITQRGKFIPPDVTRLGCCEGLGVHPALRQTQIGHYIVQAAEKLLIKDGCNYASGVCLDKISLALFRRLGYDTAFEFPYNKYKENGNVVYDNLEDNSESCTLVMRKLT